MAEPPGECWPLGLAGSVATAGARHRLQPPRAPQPGRGGSRPLRVRDQFGWARAITPCYVTAFLLALILLLHGNLGCAAQPAGDGASAPARWVSSQQHRVTRLMRSYAMPGDHRAWTYDQAIAIIYFIEAGLTTRAVRCADALLRLRDARYDAWHDAYDARNGEVAARAVAVGPNAWMGIALLRLHRTTGNQAYLRAALKMAAFLKRLQVTTGPLAGAIRCGFDERGRPLTWISTEHEVDSVACLGQCGAMAGDVSCTVAARRAERFVYTTLWDAEEHRFHPGMMDIDVTPRLSDLDELLDSQTWTILALAAVRGLPDWRHDAVMPLATGLDWIARYETSVSSADGRLHGFAKITRGPWARPGIWTEGTAGYILARRVIDANADVDRFVRTLDRLAGPGGAVPYSIGISFPDAMAHIGSGDLMIAHFEGDPNALFGKVGVHGAGEPNWEAIEAAEEKEPFSGYLEADLPGYSAAMVHTGRQSYRLVLGTRMSVPKQQRWASLGLDLCPGADVFAPTDPVDASGFGDLVFWARTEEGSARVEVGFRDATARSYDLQARATPRPALIRGHWERFRVALAPLRHQVDLEQLVHVAFEYGTRNPAGTVIYLDDVYLHARDDSVPCAQDRMPALDPHHLPFHNVGATCWREFVAWNLNPFEVPVHE